jgi:transcriptional regulator with PAS, ATPase and Fis domain
LHTLSPRKPRPFVAVNCAAIPETLIESEIFGHEKGAFTGAVERRAGCFELATGGTLLLDELAEMPAGTQAKLLRVLEERKLRRLGARTEQDVDVRVLAATNRDPEKAVVDGQLRADLFYRLNVFHITMPPLREHMEDLPAMAEVMIEEMNQKHGRRVSGVASSMLDRMMSYDWPGRCTARCRALAARFRQSAAQRGAESRCQHCAGAGGHDGGRGGARSDSAHT